MRFQPCRVDLICCFGRLAAGASIVGAVSYDTVPCTVARMHIGAGFASAIAGVTCCMCVYPACVISDRFIMCCGGLQMCVCVFISFCVCVFTVRCAGNGAAAEDATPFHVERCHLLISRSWKMSLHFTSEDVTPLTSRRCHSISRRRMSPY